MSFQLPKFTDEDFEVDYSISSSSTGSSGASSPSSASTTCSATSSDSGHLKNHRLAATAPEESFLLKKRTMPVRFCPKPRAPTSRFHPVKITESQAPKIPYKPRPLQHIHKRSLTNTGDNENMRKYREFRQMEIQKAQEAKSNGGYDELPMKKRAQKRRN